MTFRRNYALLRPTNNYPNFYQEFDFDENIDVISQLSIPKSLNMFVFNKMIYFLHNKASLRTLYFSKGTICCIGEDYAGYKKKHRFRKTAIDKYANQIKKDVDFCNNIMFKEGYEVSYDVRFFKFELGEPSLDGESSDKICEDVLNSIKNYVEKIYGRENIYVPGYLVEQEIMALSANVQKFIDMGISYIEKGKRVKYGLFDFNKEVKEKTVIFPFVVKTKTNSSVIEFSDYLERNIKGIMPFDKEHLIQQKINLEPFKDTGLLEILTKEVEKVTGRKVITAFEKVMYAPYDCISD